MVLKHIKLPLAHFTLEVDVRIHDRITVLFGPSGSGKTSLLDLAAGLRLASSAFIQLDDDVLTDTCRDHCVPARQRRIGYVPQDLALFPHFTVRQNLLYGHRRKHDGKIRFEHVVELLEIAPMVGRSIGELSGGEKQRVALGRALLTSPRLLLLDEPMASLDMKLKAKILPYLARVRDEFRIPMLYVTHDRFETLSLADEIVVMAQGRILQTGAASEVFSRPANLSVAGILTVETIQPGHILEIDNDLVTVAIGATHIRAVDSNLPPSTKAVHVCIRAEDVILMKGDDTSSSPRNHLSSIVRSVVREGSLMRIELDCGFPLTALLTKQACEEMALQPKDRVIALVKAPHVHLIPR